jgi:hypothetical protein
MSSYGFYLNLRFWHPTIDPRSITDALGREPERACWAGDPKTSPTGRALQGVWARSYWSQGIVRMEDSSVFDAETAIDRELDALQPHAEFLLEFNNSGGTGMLELNSWGDGSYAIILTPGILGKAARIAVALAHQVYRVRQN